MSGVTHGLIYAGSTQPALYNVRNETSVLYEFQAGALSTTSAGVFAFLHLCSNFRSLLNTTRLRHLKSQF